MRNATGRRSMLLGIVLMLIAGVLNGQAMTQQLGTRLAEGPKLDSPFTTTALARVISIELREEPFEQALRKVAKEANLRVLFSTDGLPSNKDVSLSLSEVTIASALSEVMSGTNLDFLLTSGGLIVVVPKKTMEQETGTITGKVNEARTGRPLPGANVLIQGTTLGASTDADGSFRIERVPPGDYTLQVRFVGYRRGTRAIKIIAGQFSTAEFVLEATVVDMDEVVVTGYVVETEIRKTESPITIIRSQDLERIPIRSFQDLFKGFVPGAATAEFGGGRDFNATVYIRGASSLDFNQSKVYVDGVEISHAMFNGTLDKNSIERVEITRGAGASTMYGSEAGGGVIQVFTKKGGAGSRLSLSLAGGVIESPWVSGTPTLREYNVDYSGGVTGFSFNLGATYKQRDPYVVENDDKVISLYGGARASTGPAVIDFTLRYGRKEFGQPGDPRFSNYPNWRVPQFLRIETPQITLGANLKYIASSWWVHNFTIGYDQEHFESYYTQPRRTTAADTLTYEGSSRYETTNLKYHTTFFFPSDGAFKSKFTLGGEWSSRRFNAASGRKILPYGNNLPLVGGIATRDKWQYGGYFAQWQPELWDMVFITAGIRAEDNDLFGDDFGMSISPRVGVALNFQYADVIVKPRISYGKGIRGVSRSQKQGIITASSRTLPNPNIGPESQVGGDLGLDLYAFDGMLNIEATYYDQTAQDLIQSVTLDPTPGKGVYQYQNAGEVRNKGYEFGAHYTIGDFDIRGTYSIMSSKVQKLTPTYTGDLKVGANVYGVPQVLANLRISYIHEGFFGVGEGGSISLELNHRGNWKNLDFEAYYAFLFGGQPYRGSFAAYYVDYKAFTKFNLALNYRMTEYLELFFTAFNLANNTSPEFTNGLLHEGRRLLVGTRITL